MKLVILIPALNEARTIGQVIDSLPKSLSGISDIEAVVINDGSTDETVQIAQYHGAVVVSHPRRMGVGSAFHTGIREALERGADIIVNIDADGQFDANDIPKLIEPIQHGTAGFVTASRFAKKEFWPKMPEIKAWGNKWVTRMVNFITQKKFTDVSCGFRAYSREAALRLTLFGKFTYTQEVFIDLVFKGIEIVEVPLKIRGQREHGKSRVFIGPWHYATKSATIMFRAARDYKPFYFIGLPGLVVSAIGLAVAIFLLIHYLRFGQTAPYRSLVTVSGVLLIIGFLLLVISLIADMIHRNRMLIEEHLYLSRKSAYRQPKNN
ncbi:MAG: glycosyltransferase family 2 protein [Candidatus Andersenbacteria bacterium]|nr:glycosyltransferase family 2 protein [Candidatus Andersenbacteria bacterium]MBI3250289.1 glycosyltransferase family 2 protein [Candidatus Andersenbacteria bacterium]